jgi:diadenylate cyclase
MTYLFTPQAALEIALLALLIYSVIAFLRGSRGAGILRGVGAVLAIVMILVLTLAKTLDLHVIQALIGNVFNILVFALIVIFQPELRSALVRVGQSPLLTSFVKERWDASDQIARAVMTLARERTGALIALQRSVGLKSYTQGGTRLDAQVSAELIRSVFQKRSPLHDGAMVLRGDRALAAACVFPLSENPNIETSLGTRHRAAVGVTEESDAVVIVVSEETGEVSIAEGGSLSRGVDEKALRRKLHVVSSEEGFRTAPIEGLS